MNLAQLKGESTLSLLEIDTCAPHRYGKQLPLAYKDLGLP